MPSFLKACEIRQSSLSLFQRSQGISLKDRFVRVKGKGGKERVVPFGGRAQRILGEFILLRNQVREAHMHKNGKDFVFTSSRGGKMNRSTFLRVLKKLNTHLLMSIIINLTCQSKT